MSEHFILFYYQFLVAVVIATFREQSVAVKGIVNCRGIRQPGTFVQLYDEDAAFLFDRDDLLGSINADDHGVFCVRGYTTEITDIEPYIYIEHNCGYEGLDQKHYYIREIPVEFVVEGNYSRKTYHMGDIELLEKDAPVQHYQRRMLIHDHPHNGKLSLHQQIIQCIPNYVAYKDYYERVVVGGPTPPTDQTVVEQQAWKDIEKRIQGHGPPAIELPPDVEEGGGLTLAPPDYVSLTTPHPVTVDAQHSEEQRLLEEQEERKKEQIRIMEEEEQRKLQEIRQEEEEEQGLLEEERRKEDYLRLEEERREEERLREERLREEEERRRMEEELRHLEKERQKAEEARLKQQEERRRLEDEQRKAEEERMRQEEEARKEEDRLYEIKRRKEEERRREEERKREEERRREEDLRREEERRRNEELRKELELRREEHQRRLDEFKRLEEQRREELAKIEDERRMWKERLKEAEERGKKQSIHILCSPEELIRTADARRKYTEGKDPCEGY